MNILAESYRKTWSRERKDSNNPNWYDEARRFERRNEMRAVAADYAYERGWIVKLTPPQRSHR